MIHFTPEDRLRLWVEDELLKFSDEALEMTRSDLQARAYPIAQRIIEGVRNHDAEQGRNGGE
jgi:hypothetical protein